MDFQNKNLVPYLLGGLALLIVGFVAGRFAFGNHSEGANAGVSLSPAATSSVAAQPSASASAGKPVPPADPLAACEASVSAAAAKQGSDYERGTILVSFDQGETYTGATAILDSFGLKPHTDPSPQGAYAANHWLSVTTPKGQEFMKICQLKDVTGVKYAGPNYTFKLAQ